MNICVFGDSIVWGEGDNEHGGWCQRLKNYFLQKDPDSTVFNLGIPGEASSNLIERLEREYVTREGDVLIISIGINDSQIISGTKRVSEKVFSTIYKQLLELSIQISKKVLVVGLTRVDESKTTPIPWSKSKSYLNSRIQLFDRIIQQVAEEKKVEYIPVSEVISHTELSDGLHPNSQGHKKIFQTILPHI